jgi:AcrR family transcriptional regulator
MRTAPTIPRRAERIRQAVLQASAALLRDRGVSGFTVEAIVERTGIAKTTIYRHWPSRAELLVATIDSLTPEKPLPDTGSLRGDLVEYFSAGARALEDGSYPRQLQTIPGLIEAGQGDPGIAAAVGRATAQMLAALKAILKNARARGEVRDDRDLGTVANILVGAIFVRRAFLDKDPTHAYIEAVVDTILDGVSARPARRYR